MIKNQKSKIAITIYLLAFTINIFAQSSSFYLQTKNNRLLVNLTTGLQQSLPIAGNYNLKKAFDLTGFGLENVIKIDFTKAVENDSNFIATLMQTGYFNYVEAVPIRFTSFVPNDYQSQQWYLKKIKAFNAYDRIGNTSKIVIAIVDDGLDTAHPDIHPNLWHNNREIPGNGIDDDLNGFIDDYVGWNVANNTNNPNATNASQSHGTHCAGIASAATNNAVGIASMGYGAKIMILKCGDTSLPRRILNSIDGVAYAIKNNADIISMSYGGGPLIVTEQLLFDKANQMGIICIAAAGNDNVNTPMYPEHTTM